jgi:hypothetical protein
MEFVFPLHQMEKAYTDGTCHEALGLVLVLVLALNAVVC